MRAFSLCRSFVFAWLLCSLHPCFGGVVISEFLAENNHGLTDEDGDASDWIELYNDGVASVDLAGWRLTDALPELLVILIDIKVDRLCVREPRNAPICNSRPRKATHDGEDNSGNANPGAVDPGVIGDPRANTQPLGILFVEVE